MKSNQSSNALSPYAIRDVVSPRAVTYNGTFHQWFTTGVRRSRTLPTICVHMWSVAYVSFHELRGRAGQHSGRSAAACAIVKFLRSEEHTSELQSLAYLVCRLLLEK